ncbi:hypothetical protein [Phytohabitans suffuscus]|uniref:Tetrapyrrole biosynthesis glutamyl-tRNA reductase dimerisation domain-containing protein n=1 Tax=Phytohabitans suffuscus TaxID=624315 RepID=A0A6F8YZV8_9ACTN|nr:hypothetical protein [Phytohabitans suffuscus]BCB91619.1 hypothetical protein Psuf_089320 [Phytohabitans suffuscus]
MSIDGGRWHDDLADRVGLIVRAERERLARRRPELDAADLAAVEDTLWRIADHLLLRRARQVAVDPALAARLWDAPVRQPEVPVPVPRAGGAAAATPPYRG